MESKLDSLKNVMLAKTPRFNIIGTNPASRLNLAWVNQSVLMIGNVKPDYLVKTQNVLTNVLPWNVIQDLTVQKELVFQTSQFQLPQSPAFVFLIYVQTLCVSLPQDVLLVFVYQSKFCLLQFDYLCYSKFYFNQKVFIFFKLK